MQDPPGAPAILAAVIAFLRDTAAPELTGHARFEARVAANALEIVRRDRAWNDSAARTQLLTLFEAVGLEDPWVSAQRRKLSQILFA